MDLQIIFWITTISFIILGLGLLADILIVVLYWEKWPRFFRSRLSAVPWYIRDVFLVCSMLVLVLFVIDAVISLSGISKYDEFKTVTGLVNICGKYGLGLWIIFRYLNRRYGIKLRDLGIRWVNIGKLSLKGFIFYIGFMPVMALLTYISLILCGIFGIEPQPHQLVEILAKEKSIWYILYLAVTASVFAPIFEEVIFRGFIYQGLKKNLGVVRSVLISSALFSLLHFNTAQFLPVMGLGILLCFMFEYTGSLIPVIIVHMFNNAFFLGLFFLLKDYI